MHILLQRNYFLKPHQNKFASLQQLFAMHSKETYQSLSPISSRDLVLIIPLKDFVTLLPCTLPEGKVA
jgi:hypothetical protein